nr:hypothetical protein KXZ65_22835 [Pectobacterium sp. PL152]
MKLRTRIALLCGTTLLGMLILSAVALNTLYKTMMSERIGQLSTLVQLAHSAAQRHMTLKKRSAVARGSGKRG